MVKYISKDFRFQSAGLTTTANGYGSNTTTPEPNTTDEQGNASFNNKQAATSFKETFADVKRNIENLQVGQTDKTWGEAIAADEQSNWISLKQYLLYLATRYTPQSLVPFVELIPCAFTQNSTGVNLNDKNSYNGTDDYYSSLGEAFRGDAPGTDKRNADKEKAINQTIEAEKFGIDPARYDQGVNSLNNATLNKTDLFSLDPFNEGSTPKSETRNLGYRVYSQLVLSPDYTGDTGSKPGAIGFTSFEIKTGASSENGLALISMTLLDVQGNKFTDINSPWSFIFDVRPGNLAGDFYFRYGWQIRVPDPNNSLDASSKSFWNHEGWKLFGDVKQEIQSQLRPELTLMLTQSINQPVKVGTQGVGPVKDADYSNDIIPSLFDEGVHYDPNTGLVDTSKKALGEPNYVKLSVLNPKIEINPAGGVEVILNFRTTGSVVEALPIAYATQTKALFRDVVSVRKDKRKDIVSLTDLILAVMLDNASGSLRISNEANAKTRAEQDVALYKSKYLSDKKDVSNLIFVTGAIAGIQNNNIDPNKINLKIDQDLSDRLLKTEKKNSTSTLLKWLRDILSYNECALLSAATGSGSGINSTWVIATTQQITEEQLISKNRPIDVKSKETKLWERISQEKDVFSFRFQGSLVEELKVEKVEKGNAITVQMDNAIEDFPGVDLTASETARLLNKPITPADKQRNLLVFFAQTQAVEVVAMCHPWTGPGKRFFVKGMGFFDGEYMALEVTHTLTKNNKFITKLKGVRMLIPDKKEEQAESKKNAALDNIAATAETVNEQYKYQPIDVSSASVPNVVNLQGTFGDWVTLEDLMQIARTPNKTVLSKIVEPLNETLKKYGINNYYRICHFLAQTMEETGDYKTFTEDLNYSAAGLLTIWGPSSGTKLSPPISKEEAAKLAHKPKETAMRVYGFPYKKDLGNLNPEDGWTYRGRGIIQTTGRGNYQDTAKALNIDIVNKPDLLLNQQHACDSAGYYWSKVKGKRDEYWDQLRVHINEIIKIKAQIKKYEKEGNTSEVAIWKQKQRNEEAKRDEVKNNTLLNKIFTIAVLCDQDQIVGITHAVNAGEINLATRRLCLERAKKALIRYKDKPVFTSSPYV